MRISKKKKKNITIGKKKCMLKMINVMHYVFGAADMIFCLRPNNQIFIYYMHDIF